MDFSKVFGAFSHRNPASGSSSKPLTSQFRNRVLMLCRDTFEKTGRQVEFWVTIHGKLTYAQGRPRLTDKYTPDLMTDAVAFLTTCSDEHFLDFLEYMFETANTILFPDAERALVRDINRFLLVDDLPYAVTDYVWHTSTVKPQYGSERTISTLTAYPQLIRRDSQVTHTYTVGPTLALLADQMFSSANKEFLEALEDYRKNDLGDCLTKCGSAFESTLKIICSRNNWPYQQSDTAGPLLRIVFDNCKKLEPYLEPPLLIVATLRNRLSKSHGSGTEPRDLTAEKAEYAINATAAAILLLVRSCT